MSTTEDMTTPITPGSLCREFMASSRFTDGGMRVVMGGNDGTRQVSSLGAMWPKASPFTRLGRDEQVKAGARIGALASAERAAAAWT